MTTGFASYPDVTYQEFVSKMQAEIHNLPKQEARIAQYILLNLDSLSLETGKTIARKAGVAEVTVGRLLRRLGCDGMKELKQLLRQRYSVAGDMHTPRGEIPHRWRGSLSADLAAVQSIYEQADGEDFINAREILIAAKEIYVTGFQSVRGLAEDAARRLGLARTRVWYLSAHDSMLAEWLKDNEASNSCLLLIDVVPYATESRSLAQIARAQDRRVIMISDEYCHWAREVTDAVIYASSANGLFLESTLGLNTALSLLIDAVAQQDSQASEQRLRQWKLHSKRLGLF